MPCHHLHKEDHFARVRPAQSGLWRNPAVATLTLVQLGLRVAEGARGDQVLDTGWRYTVQLLSRLIAKRQLFRRETRLI